MGIKEDIELMCAIAKGHSYELAAHRVEDWLASPSCPLVDEELEMQAFTRAKEDGHGAWKCPQCKEINTMDIFPALSRVDNETEICPDCGTREALENFLKQKK